MKNHSLSDTFISSSNPAGFKGYELLAWLMPITVFFTPINKAPFNIFLFFSCLASIFGVIYGLWFAPFEQRQDFKQRFKAGSIRLFRHPLMIFCLGLFALYAISLGYTVGKNGEPVWFLNNHRHLLYPLLLLPLFFDEKIRKRSVIALFASCSLILFLSFVVYALNPSEKVRGWFFLANTESQFFVGNVFQDYLRQGIQMTWLLGFSALLALCGQNDLFKTQISKWFFLALSLLVLINLVFVLQARTAQIIAFFLLLWLGFYRFGWRGLIVTGALTPIFFLLAYFSSAQFQHRVGMTVAQIRDPVSAADFSKNNYNPRQEMWAMSIDAVKEKPIFGYGVGSYRTVAQVYPSKLDDFSRKTHPDPHNQLIYVLFELGIVGLLWFVVGIILLWRYATRLQKPEWAKLAIIVLVGAGMTNVVLTMSQPYQFFIILLSLFFAQNLKNEAQNNQFGGQPL